MTDIERFLKDYWFATRSIGRLLLDLCAARVAYKDSYGQMPMSKYKELRVKERSNLSPTELAVIITVDQYRAEVESIEQRLREERRTIAVIEHTVCLAGLTGREKEYVKLRYFENKQTEAVAQRMYCSLPTAGRIREQALKKIEKVERF